MQLQSFLITAAALPSSLLGQPIKSIATIVETTWRYPIVARLTGAGCMAIRSRNCASYGRLVIVVSFHSGPPVILSERPQIFRLLQNPLPDAGQVAPGRGSLVYGAIAS